MLHFKAPEIESRALGHMTIWHNEAKASAGLWSQEKKKEPV
jgi:hypothetical protein